MEHEMSESNNKEPSKIKIKLENKKFWIGFLVGILMVSLLFIHELNPAFDTPCIIGENAIIYLVIAGIVVGLIIGNRIEKSALAGVLAGTIAFSLVIIKGLIFDSTYTNLKSSTPLQVSAVLLYMILMLALPMALGGAIGGMVGEIMKRAGTGIVMKKAVIVVLVGIVILISIYWYSQQGIQTEKPNFDMNGTINYVIFSCLYGAPCNPQYRLDGEDGNTYNLHFKPGARIPNWTQHIEVIGIETNQTDCFENYCENGTGPCKLIPCQPIGTVNVLNWRQR
jgi:hypothetical protein